MKMSIYLLLYLFFLTVFLTLTFSLIIKNRGPWNNPMLFFLILFLTSWSIFLWLGPADIQDRSYPYASVTGLTVLISMFLAATKTIKTEKNRMRRIRDRKVLEVETKSDYRQERFLPNAYFWLLIIIESLAIITAYFLRFNIPMA